MQSEVLALTFRQQTFAKGQEVYTACLTVNPVEQVENSSYLAFLTCRWPRIWSGLSIIACLNC